MAETFIERYAERLDRENGELRKRVEELAAKNAELESKLTAAQAGGTDAVTLWQGRARDLRTTINSIVMEGTSSRQDVQSRLLMAMQRNEW